MMISRISLPLQTKTTSRYDKIQNKKLQTKADVLCKGFPDEFQTYLKYARKLKFDEKPDYAYIKKLLKVRKNLIMRTLRNC
jgi:hypothetical protein